MKKNAFQASSPNSSIIQNGDLFLIDMRKIIPLPWDQWAEEIIQNGYSIITLTPSIQIDFLEMQKLIGGISYHDRKEFSFVEHSDGFTPVGYSYNNDAANTDLCETFNFWQKNSPQHKNFKFSDDKFYSHITNYESQISIYGQHLINAILRKYDYRTEISIREDSYLQFNYFKEELRSNGKKYLQQTQA